MASTVIGTCALYPILLTITSLHIMTCHLPATTPSVCRHLFLRGAPAIAENLVCAAIIGMLMPGIATTVEPGCESRHQHACGPRPKKNGNF
jgi:hypothetical protein